MSRVVTMHDGRECLLPFPRVHFYQGEVMDLWTQSPDDGEAARRRGFLLRFVYSKETAESFLVKATIKGRARTFDEFVSCELFSQIALSEPIHMSEKQCIAFRCIAPPGPPGTTTVLDCALVAKVLYEI